MNRVNHLAVLVSVVLHQLLGFVWYSAAPWAVARLEALGRPATDVNVVDPVGLASDIVGWIVASYVMAWAIEKSGSRGAMPGVRVGLVLWIGIAMPAVIPHYVFAGIRPMVTAIDAANLLVACVVTGAIVGGWRRTARK